MASFVRCEASSSRPQGMYRETAPGRALILTTVCYHTAKCQVYASITVVSYPKDRTRTRRRGNSTLLPALLQGSRRPVRTSSEITVTPIADGRGSNFDLNYIR